MEFIDRIIAANTIEELKEILEHGEEEDLWNS